MTQGERGCGGKSKAVAQWGKQGFSITRKGRGGCGICPYGDGGNSGRISYPTAVSY